MEYPDTTSRGQKIQFFLKLHAVASHKDLLYQNLKSFSYKS